MDTAPTFPLRKVKGPTAIIPSTRGKPLPVRVFFERNLRNSVQTFLALPTNVSTIARNQETTIRESLRRGVSLYGKSAPGGGPISCSCKIPILGYPNASFLLLWGNLRKSWCPVK